MGRVSDNQQSHINQYIRVAFYIVPICFSLYVVILKHILVITICHAFSRSKKTINLIQATYVIQIIFILGEKHTVIFIIIPGGVMHFFSRGKFITAKEKDCFTSV